MLWSKSEFSKVFCFFIHILFSFSQNSINIYSNRYGERRTLMAKKFGKLLLVTAALSAVAGGAYYYLKGRDSLMDDEFLDDEDFDNFDEDLNESDSDRNYVDLDLGKAEENDSKEELKELKEEVKEEFQEGIQAAKAEATDKIVGSEKKVEEFFDDDDEEDDSDDYMNE